ncbi:hypothetical protein Tco_1247073 [Tanacetum coccineum]
MHENKSFNRNPANHALYHALIEALIEDENAMDKGVTDTVKNHKRQHDDDDDDDVEEPSAGPNQVNTVGEDVVRDDDQPIRHLRTQDKTRSRTQDWFKKPPRPHTPDPKWNKRQVILDQPEQPCIKLEYNIEECFKALADRLDWNNPEGDRCPFDLTKPLPLKGRPGHLSVAAEYFFNNDLEFLKSFDREKKYTTSITKTKVARYEIVEIEDMTPTLWSTIKHGSQVNKISKHNVYSTQKILGVKSVSVKKLHGYGHLEEIVVKRADRQLYKFKEDGILKTVRDELHHIILDFCMGYNKEMSRRKWTATDKKRSKLMVKLIDKQMQERRIIQNMEQLVGAWELEMDYKLITHIV